MKIRALKSFEGIKDLERDVFPKEGEVWEVSEERANFLKSHGVIEIVEEDKEEVKINLKTEVTLDKEKVLETLKEKPTKQSKKKNKKTSE